MSVAIGLLDLSSSCEEPNFCAPVSGDGAAKLPSVGPRIVGKPDVRRRLIRDVHGPDAVARGRGASALVRSRRFQRPDLSTTCAARATENQ